jgi:hypothetical protein
MRLRAKFSKRMRMSVDTLAGQFPTDARRAQPGLSVFIWRMSERISPRSVWADRVAGRAAAKTDGIRRDATRQQSRFSR